MIKKRLLTFEEVQARGVTHGRRHVDRLEAAGEFPKRVPVGTNRVAWIATEIDDYIDSLIAKRATDLGVLGSAGTVPVRNPATPGSRVRRDHRAQEEA
jgi:prophage regulatory protein